MYTAPKPTNSLKHFYSVQYKTFLRPQCRKLVILILWTCNLKASGLAMLQYYGFAVKDWVPEQHGSMGISRTIFSLTFNRGSEQTLPSSLILMTYIRR